MYSIEIFETDHYMLIVSYITGSEWASLKLNIVRWIGENRIGPFDLHVDSKTHKCKIVFVKEEDAVAFKLRWIEK